MNDNFETLGPTEKFAADQLTNAINECKTVSAKLAKSFDEIDTDLVADAILDNDKKELLLSFVDRLQKVASNMTMTELVVIVLDVSLKPKEVKDV